MSAAGTIFVRNRQRRHRVDMRAFRKLARTLLDELLRQPYTELGVYVVGAPEMTRLNESFLRHRGSTDVITFDYSEPPPKTESPPAPLCGEIFVCLDEALIQARRFRTDWQTELTRYVVHGVLHLCGYDDHHPAARRRMKREENRLLRILRTRR